MLIELPNDRDIEAQATSAGFSSVEAYVRTLIDRDAERVAIQEGIDAMNAGDMQPWEEVKQELQNQFGLNSRADAERVAIQQGIDDMKAGRMRPFEEFEAEMRRDYGFAKT
jgi:predicted transcriptional regulator